MKYFKKIGKIAVPAAALFLPIMSFAAFTVPGEPTTTGAWTLEGFKSVIQSIGNFMIFIGIIVAVIFIIWGGIKYMTAGGEPKKAEEARTAILNGIIGAAVVLGVGIILRTAAALISGAFFGVTPITP